MSQSIYAVSLWLDNFTSSFLDLQITVQSIARNNVTVINMFRTYTILGAKDLYQDSNTSVHIANCHFNSFEFKFSLVSTQVAIEDSLFQYKYGKALFSADHVQISFTEECHIF